LYSLSNKKVKNGAIIWQLIISQRGNKVDFDATKGKSRAKREIGQVSRKAWQAPVLVSLSGEETFGKFIVAAETSTLAPTGPS
jgi:hypothetical protein